MKLEEKVYNHNANAVKNNIMIERQKNCCFKTDFKKRERTKD